jgi:hypothetical protein
MESEKSRCLEKLSTQGMAANKMHFGLKFKYQRFVNYR